MSTATGILTRGRIDPGTDVAVSLLTWGRIREYTTDVFIGVPVYGSPAPIAHINGCPVTKGLHGTPAWVQAVLGDPFAANVSGAPTAIGQVYATDDACATPSVTGAPAARKVITASNVRVAIIGTPAPVKTLIGEPT